MQPKNDLMQAKNQLMQPKNDLMQPKSQLMQPKNELLHGESQLKVLKIHIDFIQLVLQQQSKRHNSTNQIQQAMGQDAQPQVFCLPDQINHRKQRKDQG